MTDVEKSFRVGRKRWLSFAIVPILAGLGLTVAVEPAQAALTYNCPNGDVHAPPYNWTDRCSVFSFDKGTNFVGEMTGATDCNAAPHIDTQRVRVIADYVASGDKLLIRSIGIRYVRGSVPWAWYQVNIVDGNGVFYKRAFNNNGNTIITDNATYTQDNVMVVTPTAGFAPPFGANNTVSIQIRPTFTRDGARSAAGQIECASDTLAMIFVGP